MESNNVIDWEIMKKGARSIANRKYILYGTGSAANRVLSFLKVLGLEQQVLSVSDSNSKKWGEQWCTYDVISPAEIQKYQEETLIIISSNFVKEIADNLKNTGCKNEIVGSTALRLAFHYDIIQKKADYLEEKRVAEYEKKYDVWHRLIGDRMYEKSALEGFSDTLKAIAEQSCSILICGVQKTGTMTLKASLEKVKIARWLLNRTCRDESELNDLKSVIEAFPDHEIRIITGVREPVERVISARWQIMRNPSSYEDELVSTVVDDNYDAFCDVPTCKRKYRDCFMFQYADVKNWFDDQIKEVFGIDIFDYPFDKEKGWSIIRKGNISIFCYRLDKLSSLENEIGEFTGVKDFSLKRDNSAADKSYYYAYKAYLEEVKIKKEFFEQLMQSEAVTHFYTEEECENMRRKWGKRFC